MLAVAAALAWDQMNEVIDNVQRRNYVRQLDTLKNNQRKLMNSLDQVARLHSRKIREWPGACGQGLPFSEKQVLPPRQAIASITGIAADRVTERVPGPIPNRASDTPSDKAVNPASDTQTRTLPGRSARTTDMVSTLPDTGCASRLSLLKHLSSSLSDSIHVLWDYPEIGSRTFNPEHTFLAQTGIFAPGRGGVAAPDSHATHDTIAAATEFLQPDLRRWSERSSRPAAPFMTGLHRTATGSQPIFSFAAPVYGVSHQLLAVTTLDIERQAFDRLLLGGVRLPGFFVFDISRDKPILLNATHGDEQPLLRAIQRHWRFLAAGVNDLSVVEAGEFFYFVEAIAGTPWVAVYGFSFGDILMVSESLWMWIGFSMFGSLLLLWSGIYLVNRYVLVPLSQASQRIVASEQLNRTIIATAPVGLCMLDLQTMQPLLANDLASAYARRWGQRPDLAHSILAAHRDMLRSEPLAGTARRDSAAGTVLYTELPMPDQIDAPPLLAAFSHVWYQGREVLLCGLSDITIHKEAENMLLQARKSADEANEAKSMFLATISHEIRTPLHGAMGNLELLEKTRLSAAQRSTVGTINRAFGSLLQIINNVLDLSKAGAGQLHLADDPFDLSDLLEDVARTFAPCIVKKNVRFLFHVDSNIPARLRGDAARLRQLFNNLLSNAVKFTRAGAIVMRAEVIAAAPASCTFSVIVLDTGIGISSEDQRRLFVPFQQANKSIAATFGGTGLGLSLVKNLCDAMDGTIAIDSRPAAGTEVRVTLALPIAAQPSETQAYPHASGHTLRDVPVVLHCADAAWSAQLAGLLRSHGASVEWRGIGAALPLPPQNYAGGTVLIACQDNEQAVRLEELKKESADAALRYVLLTPLGPLRPERHTDAIRVSALSREGLLLAIHPEFVAPPPSATDRDQGQAQDSDRERDGEPDQDADQYDRHRHAGAPVGAGSGEFDRLYSVGTEGKYANAGWTRKADHADKINNGDQRGALSESGAAAPSQTEGAAAPPFAILLVEDDPVNVTLAQQQLMLLGYTDIDRAANGREALEKCADRSYRLILTDQFMPEMDGNLLAAALRERACPSTIIMITASRPSPAHRKNIDGLLLKPVSLDQLRRALHAYAPRHTVAATTAIANGTASEATIASTTGRNVSVSSRTALQSMLWQAFLEDYDSTMHALQAGIDAGHAGRCRQQLHKLKGALKILKEPLAHQVETLEAASQDRPFDDLKPAFLSLGRALQTLVEAHRGLAEAGSGSDGDSDGDGDGKC